MAEKVAVWHGINKTDITPPLFQPPYPSEHTHTHTRLDSEFLLCVWQEVRNWKCMVYVEWGGGGGMRPSVGFSRDFLPSMWKVLCEVNGLEEDFNQRSKPGGSCYSMWYPRFELRKVQIRHWKWRAMGVSTNGGGWYFETSPYILG